MERKDSGRLSVLLQLTAGFDFVVPGGIFGRNGLKGKAMIGMDRKGKGRGGGSGDS